MTKYGNRKTVVDGIQFDSQKEATRWCELKLMEKAKEIYNLQRQVRFELIPTQLDARKKILERPAYYIADFVYCDKNGNRVVEDTKGLRTREYILKRKLMLKNFGIRIKEV